MPYFDMLNHNNPVNTNCRYNKEKNGMEIVVFGRIKEGFEVFNTYGENGDAHIFLIHYGFYDSTQKIKIELTFTLTQDQSNYPLKLQILKDEASKQTFSLSKSTNSDPALYLAAKWLRFVHAEAKVLEKLKEWDEITESSKESEIKIWTQLLEEIESKLGKYDREKVQSIENDQIKLLLTEELLIQEKCRDVARNFIEIYKYTDQTQINDKIKELEKEIEVQEEENEKNYWKRQENSYVDYLKDICIPVLKKDIVQITTGPGKVNKDIKDNSDDYFKQFF